MVFDGVEWNGARKPVLPNPLHPPTQQLIKMTMRAARQPSGDWGTAGRGACREPEAGQSCWALRPLPTWQCSTCWACGTCLDPSQMLGHVAAALHNVAWLAPQQLAPLLLLLVLLLHLSFHGCFAVQLHLVKSSVLPLQRGPHPAPRALHPFPLPPSRSVLQAA